MCYLFCYRPFSILEYDDLCNDVREAFPGLASLVDSIESALATMIAEDLKKDDNDGNLLDLDSYAHCIHIPALDERITPEVSIQLNCIAPKVLLQHDLFFGQCGDAVLVPHQSWGAKLHMAALQIPVQAGPPIMPM